MRDVVTTSVEPASRFLARTPAWDDLLSRAVDPNPHFSPRVVGAHLAHGLVERDLRVLSVEAGGRLVALLPFRLTGSLAGGRVASPFASPYVTSGAPLVAGGADFAPALAALAAALGPASGDRPWRWPLLPVDGAVGAGLLAALADRGWSAATVASFPRAVLHRRADLAAYEAAHPDRGRARDLARRRRRLASEGGLTIEVAGGGQTLAIAVEAFLALEARGWKGLRGSAMACHPDTAALARDLFAERTGPVRARADVIALDGRPIAVSLALVAGGTATLLKTAYDETYRRFAPGLVLEDAIVRALHETGFAGRLDSASRPGSVLESLYPDRERIADLVLAPAATAGALARRARWRAAAGERARDAVEGLRAFARRGGRREEAGHVVARERSARHACLPLPDGRGSG